jgi:hypothetical protein
MRIVCRNCFHMWKAATLTPCPNCECSDLTVSDVSGSTTNSCPNGNSMAVRIGELESQNANVLHFVRECCYLQDTPGNINWLHYTARALLAELDTKGETE